MEDILWVVQFWAMDWFNNGWEKSFTGWVFIHREFVIYLPSTYNWGHGDQFFKKLYAVTYALSVNSVTLTDFKTNGLSMR